MIEALTRYRPVLDELAREKALAKQLEEASQPGELELPDENDDR
jgi:hypothetical protein